MTTVSAPGSSANLGPGFDVLGVAVDRRVRVSDEGMGTPCESDHIARIAFEQAGGIGPLWFDFDLEPGKGLGFSAAARAAGAVLGRLHAGDDIEHARTNAYEVVCELEGHGDNAAPSVFGGIQLVAGRLAHPIAASLPGALLVWVASEDTATDESRQVLSSAVPRDDAVFNLGRLGLLLAALYEGRPDLLRVATEDRLHQPARLAGNASSARAIAAALDAGALAAWLSGSGPAVAIVVEPSRSEEVAAALPASGSVLRLRVDQLGSVSQ